VAGVDPGDLKALAALAVADDRLADKILAAELASVVVHGEASAGRHADAAEPGALIAEHFRLKPGARRIAFPIAAERLKHFVGAVETKRSFSGFSHGSSLAK